MAKKLRGFSLIEMVIVMVLTSIVIVMTSTVISTGYRNYFSAVNSTSLSTQAAIIMARMTDEIQLASTFSSISANGLTFITSTGSTISYSWTSPTLTRTGTGAQIMSNQVTAFSLTYYQPSFATTSTLSAVTAVTVSFTLSNGSEKVPLINTIYVFN